MKETDLSAILMLANLILTNILEKKMAVFPRIRLTSCSNQFLFISYTIFLGSTWHNGSEITLTNSQVIVLID